MAASPTNGLAAAADLGRAKRIDDARGRYIENLKSSFPKGLTLKGLKIVVDSAHGAAYHLAADLFFELGAEVVRLGTRPNGLNINDGCGSNEPAHAARDGAGRARRPRRGARRRRRPASCCRRAGQPDRRRPGPGPDRRQLAGDQRLRGEAVVATVMSNLGLEKHLAGLGLTLLRTKVGDRYVVERMRADGYNVGGEQSGHIILSDFATTGDGLLAALQVLAVIRRRDRPASEVTRVFDAGAAAAAQRADCSAGSTWPHPRSWGCSSTQQARLDGTGRLLVRASGTEPLIRVMVEAEDEAPAGRHSGDRQPADRRSGAARRLTSWGRPSRAAAAFPDPPGRCSRLERFLYARHAGRSAACHRSELPLAGCALPWTRFFASHARGWNEQDHRYRSRHDEQLRRDHGGQERPRDRERGGHAHDALDGRLHRGRRGAGRHAGQAPGGDQSREHAVRGQAPDRPPVRGPRRPQGHGHGVLQDRARPTTATPGCRCATRRRRRRRSAPRSSRR